MISAYTIHKKKRSIYLTLHDYIGLFHVALKRNESPYNYYLFQRFQGDLLIKYFLSRGILFNRSNVLDLGSGLGGYSSALKNMGCQVVSVDIDGKNQFEDLVWVNADALRLPFQKSIFNIVICSSLIEHVEKPLSLLQEIVRVTQNNGIIYLSFPPFYSFKGGHQFAPFHLLGEKIAINIFIKRNLFKSNRWLSEKFPNSPTSYKNAFGSWGLYPLTISRIQSIISSLPVKVYERSTRWIPFDFSGIPTIGEFLTWHVQFILVKK